MKGLLLYTADTVFMPFLLYAPKPRVECETYRTTVASSEVRLLPLFRVGHASGSGSGSREPGATVQQQAETGELFDAVIVLVTDSRAGYSVMMGREEGEAQWKKRAGYGTERGCAVPLTGLLVG